MMKLLTKKEDDSSTKKGRGQEGDKKAPAKTASEKPAKPKRAELVKKPPKKPAEPKMAWMTTVREYLREVVYELRKVVWPSRKETLGSTAVVLVIVGLSSVFLGIVDFILSRLVRLLIG